MSIRKEYNGYDEATSIAAADLIKFKDAITGIVYKIQKSKLAKFIMTYNEYVMLISQSGTDAPTVTVLQDDFTLSSDISFTRDSTGVYKADITDLGFSATNHHIEVDITQLYEDTATAFDYANVTFDTNNTEIILRSYDYDDSTGVTLADGKLSNRVLIIKEYATT